MKFIYTFYIALLLPLFSFSQSPAAWSPYYSNSQIKVEYKEADCQVAGTDISKKILVFRLTNLTSKTLEISWAQELHYGNKCLNCDGTGTEHSHKAILSPGTSLEGNCTANNGAANSGLVIFKKFNAPPAMADNSKQLTDFSLKNIAVAVK